MPPGPEQARRWIQTGWPRAFQPPIQANYLNRRLKWVVKTFTEPKWDTKTVLTTTAKAHTPRSVGFTLLGGEKKPSNLHFLAWRIEEPSRLKGFDSIPRRKYQETMAPFSWFQRCMTGTTVLTHSARMGSTMHQFELMSPKGCFSRRGNDSCDRKDPQISGISGNSPQPSISGGCRRPFLSLGQMAKHESLVPADDKISW